MVFQYIFHNIKWIVGVDFSDPLTFKNNNLSILFNNCYNLKHMSDYDIKNSKNIQPTQRKENVVNQ